MSETLIVEMMQSEELNDWVSEALDRIDGDDKRGIVTMSIMIATFYNFMSENPQVSECFEIYMDAEDEFEKIH
jgi:hypothetical protein